MSDRSTDPRFLHSQDGDAERLRVRQDMPRRFSERPNDEMLEQVVAHVATPS